MVCNGKLTKMEDLGVHLFLETPIYTLWIFKTRASPQDIADYKALTKTLTIVLIEGN